ncbi:hypothetical protein Btru_055908 [Bulinus truncatus]|nr:hypothetical protein Btru_055908 [Bulinus truncatus]
MTGVICQFNQLFTDFTSLIATGVLVGVLWAQGSRCCLWMLLEIVGLTRMSRCLSIAAVAGTLSVAAHSPALSAIVQSTGSFSIVLCYVGAAMIISAIGLLLTPLVARLDTKRGKKLCRNRIYQSLRTRERGHDGVDAHTGGHFGQADQLDEHNGQEGLSCAHEQADQHAHDHQGVEVVEHEVKLTYDA